MELLSHPAENLRSIEGIQVTMEKELRTPYPFVIPKLAVETKKFKQVVIKDMVIDAATLFDYGLILELLLEDTEVLDFPQSSLESSKSIVQKGNLF